MFILVSIALAAMLGTGGVGELARYYSYEEHSRQGTVVEAWVKHKKYSDHPFVVMEKVSYQSSVDGVVNCTLVGEAFDSEAVALLVARELVPKKGRPMRVPKSSTTLFCLHNNEIERKYWTGQILVTLAVLSLSFGALIFLSEMEHYKELWSPYSAACHAFAAILS
jgi:hypothetical protein